MKKTILLAIFAIVLFSECTKNTNPAPLPTYAYLEVLDLRPDSIPMNIVINQNLMTNGSVSYPFLITSSPVSPDSISVTISRNTNINPLLLQHLSNHLLLGQFPRFPSQHLSQILRQFLN